MLLKDKVAVVTGGGRGIGRVIALACAEEGANLVLAARSLEALEETRAAITGLAGSQALLLDCGRSLLKSGKRPLPSMSPVFIYVAGLSCHL